MFRKLTVEDNIKAVLGDGKAAKKDIQEEKLETLIDEFSLHKVAATAATCYPAANAAVPK